MGQLNCSLVNVQVTAPERRRSRGGRRGGAAFIPLRNSAKRGPNPTPINYNIVDADYGSFLWVDTYIGGRVLKDGAYDSSDPSAEFYIHALDISSSSFWLQPLLFTTDTAVAVDFTSDTAQIVMVDHGTEGFVEILNLEGASSGGYKIYAIDPATSRKYYWYIGFDNDVGLTEDSSIAVIISLQTVLN